MTNTNDTQATLAAFYGRLQAKQLRAKASAELKRQDAGTHVPADRFRVELTEHCVRVLDTTTGKMEYSNSIYTCALAATPIRNQVVLAAARAMKNLFIARQMDNNEGRVGQRWDEFTAVRDFLLPEKDGDIVRYVNILKAETEKEDDKRVTITSYATLSIGTAGAESTSNPPEFADSLLSQVGTLTYSDLLDSKEQNAADSFVTALTEKRLEAKLRLKAARTTLDNIRRKNREKASKPLADKFQALTGKVEEKLPTLAEAQKEQEEASRLFTALDWLAAELELVPDTANTAGKLHTGCVSRG